MRRLLVVCAAACACGTAIPALAAVDVAFDFGAISAQHGLGQMSGTDGSMRYYLDGTQTGNGVGVTITGWQARATDRNYRNRTDKLTADGSNGLGLDHREGGAEEGIDNAGRFDLVIFEFDDLVSLNRVDLSLLGSDYDMTVLAHTGSTAPVLDNGTFRPDENHSKGLTNLGWELVGHYLENDGAQVDVNNAYLSSFWAIGAYTSAITDATRTYGSPDGNGDYFLLRQLAATLADGATAVPEPGLPLLAGLALLLLLRRRARLA